VTPESPLYPSSWYGWKPPILWPFFILWQNRKEVFFRKDKNGNYYRLLIWQRHLVPNFEFLCHLVRPTDYFKIHKGYIAKKNPKKYKIAISRSNFKISKNRKKGFVVLALRIIHAKIQDPRQKNVACRPRTDRHRDTHTEKVSEWK